MSKRTLYQILQATQYSKTLSEIANKLYFSQPYLSKVLKKAEKNYGTTLIKRNTTPISLTNAGSIVLDHLQVILNTEDDLDHALKEAKSTKPIKILVTNPFLYDLVLDLVTPYISNHPELTFEISSYPVTDSLKSIKNRSFDLIIGRRYIDNDVVTMKLPQNQVFTFISKDCQVFDPDRLILPFNDKQISQLQDVRFIAFENSDGIQDYILKRFEEMGIHVKNTIKVDTVAEACRMAASIGHTAMALTSNYTAQKIAGDQNYNLGALPDNTLNLDNALIHNIEISKEVQDLADYLQEKITLQINSENNLLSNK